MKVVESLLMITFLIYFGSCIESSLTGEPDALQESGYPNVDPALWTHFESFEAAAAQLGYPLDIAEIGVTAQIEPISEDRVAGQCSYGVRRSFREITIDRDFWNQATPLYREYIIFHELGHCVLFRDHVDACFANNTWTSIMRSGHGSCFDNYTSRTRPYYIDELFSSLSPDGSEDMIGP